MTLFGPLSHPDEETVAAIARGEQAPEAAARHVRACRRCSRMLAFVRGARELLREPRGACPAPQDLVGAADAAGGDRATATASDRRVLRHLGTCLECARQLEGLLVLAREAGPLPVAAIPVAVAPSPTLGERLRALVTLEMPLRVALVTRGLAAAPTRPEFEAAMAAYGKGRYAAARKLLERARAAGDRSPAASFYLGVCALRAKRPEQAVSALADAVERRRSLGEYRFYLAQALLLAGQGQQAARELERAARQAGPRRVQARELRKRVLQALARADKARADKASAGTRRRRKR